MRTSILLAVMVLVGCRKETPKEVTTPPPAKDAGAPAEPELATPTAASTLSFFEPKEDRCEWKQVDPVGQHRVTLASFPGGCVGARVAWSPDSTKALVWFDPTLVQNPGYGAPKASKPAYAEETPDEKAKPRAFVLSTRRPKPEPLPLPDVGPYSLEELGLDALGHPFALLQQELSDAEREKGSVKVGELTFELSTESEGLPVLVHAWRREGDAWVRTETKLSTTGWDYGLGVKALDTFSQLGPRSVDLLTAFAQGDSVEPADAKKLMKLLPKGTTDDDGAWIFLGAGGARLNVWQITGEFAYTTGLVALGEQPLKDLGFTDGELVAVRTSGPFALIAGSNAGTHPRLYQLPEGKLVFSSDTARAVTFWPTTTKVETHETK